MRLCVYTRTFAYTNVYIYTLQTNKIRIGEKHNKSKNRQSPKYQQRDRQTPKILKFAQMTGGRRASEGEREGGRGRVGASGKAELVTSRNIYQPTCTAARKLIVTRARRIFLCLRHTSPSRLMLPPVPDNASRACHLRAPPANMSIFCFFSFPPAG